MSYYRTETDQTVYGYHSCRYNIGINCEYGERLPEKCERCGWNPAEEKRRKEVLENGTETASPSEVN